MADATRPEELSPTKRALLEVRALRARLLELENARTAPVAVVGMGLRFPGADGPDRFWELLTTGGDAISEVPDDRWNVDEWYDPDPAVPGKMSTRWGGFIEGVYEFDAGFFGISPREATSIDPQQRILLEVAWEALEHAGIPPDSLAGSSTGVFVGIAGMDYAQRVLARGGHDVDSYLAQGIAHSAASGRLAYSLGLEGPAVSVDTACSSSLYATHLAIRSLRAGESKIALVGGVNLILLPELLVTFSKAGMMAPDGRCKTFDARADGYVRSEGCGVLVLKPLRDAIDDGDHVWAVLRGSAANQDGRSSGMTAPRRSAQEQVLRQALVDARLEPRDVDYVEAHGTGTSLGDPIEVGALATVLGADRGNPLLIGSVKTNVGHLEAAAGVAGLAKAILAVHHGALPASLHFDEPNPLVPWTEIPVDVVGEKREFPEPGNPRVAGVSSFGFTGTNVHVLVESAPAGTPSDPDIDPHRRARLLKLSARSSDSLDRLARLVADRAAGADPREVDALCRWMNRGRADMPYRMCVAGTPGTIASTIRDHAAGLEVEGLFRGHAEGSVPEVAMLFTGHGKQRARMAAALAQRFPIVARTLEECDALASPELGGSLRSVLEAPEGTEAAARLVDGMAFSQPALFAVELALARLWGSWGVRPTMALGHSLGEYVAATVAGVFDVRDALRLVCARGRLMDSLPEGAMAAVFATEAVVSDAIANDEREVSIAAINGETEVVVSGSMDGVARVSATLVAQGLEVRRLGVTQAAHSPMLDPILDEFVAVAESVTYASPRIGLISCTTGRVVDDAEIVQPEYWRRHLREPVRFHAAMQCALDEGYRVFLEAGPHPVLTSLGRRAFPGADVSWISSLSDSVDDEQSILEAAAGLYVTGAEFHWDAADPGPRRPVDGLPTYPWQHRSYRIDDQDASKAEGEVDPLGIWTDAVEAGRREEERGPLDFDPSVFEKRWAVLDEVTTEIVLDSLAALGGVGQSPFTATELAVRMSIEPSYHRLVARWLDRLARAGHLKRGGDHFVPGDTGAPSGEPWERATELMDPDGRFLLEYLRRCADAIPGILRGETDPLETLFPGGSTETADQLYRDWSLVRYFSHIMRGAFDSLLRSRGTLGPARVIEVGAGTGGTTAVLGPIAGNRVEEYLFTDVSGAFLASAEERFDEWPWMRFAVLDLEAPLGPEIALGSYDVVVAANVLHAVRDLPATLDRVRSLLAPGGVLLALEITDYLGWFDVSTSLLEGWEHYEDALRQEHPVVGRGDWEALLLERGFARTETFPSSESPQSALGFHVLMAQQPGALSTSRAPSATGDTAIAETEVSASDRKSEERRAAFREQLGQADPMERESLLVEFVQGQIRRMLRLPESERIGRRRRLMELGLDSLMAVELRSRIDSWLKLDEPLPVTLVFDYPTVDAIVALLLDLLGASVEVVRETGSIVSAEVESPEVGIPAEVADLTDEEAEARLLRHLDSLEGS